MSFNSLDHFYDHLTTRFRRADRDLFLKRFLQWFGETLDEYNETFDTFFENIDPATASEKWIGFWLEHLFGWSWFPRWFTLADKRRLYGNFARHLARRGTRRGIELFLLDFGITARVHTRSLPWGDFVWGESMFVFSEPLSLVVEILSIASPAQDLRFWGDAPAWGEFFYVERAASYTEKEILDLIRFVEPHAQNVTVVYGSVRLDFISETLWQEIAW